MPWPNSARATGYIVTAADWNEIAAALALWGGNSDADGNSLIDVGTIVCGNGDATATTTAGTIRGTARTGTNAAGSNVTIAGGNGTGTGGGGALIFQTAPTGTSGSTANTLTERMRVAADGSVVVGSPTGGGQGAGTINAQAIAINTTLGSAPDAFSVNGLISAKTTSSSNLNSGTGYNLAFTSGQSKTSTSSGNQIIILSDNSISSGNPLLMALSTVGGSTSADRKGMIEVGEYGAGSSAYLHLVTGGGVVVDSPTGGAKGAGTINATAVYDDGVLLTCYVPELKNKGGDTTQIDVEQWDARVPDRVIPAKVDRVTGEVIEPERVEVRRHEPLRDFLANRADTIDPRSYAQRWKSTGVLPGFPSPQEWADNGPLSIGQLLQKLWEHIELQAVHISTLCDEIDELRG